MKKKSAAKKPAPAGDANDHYNRGLRMMGSIERPLRAGEMNDEERKVADEAEGELLTALEIAPNHGRAMIMLGMLYRFTARYEEAIPHLEGALDLPRDCDDWTKAVDSLAGVHMQTDQHKKAVKLLEDAVTDHGGDPFLVVKLAACYDHLKKPKDALKVLEAGLRAKPGDPQMSSALAEVKEKVTPTPPQPELSGAAKKMQDQAMKLGQALQKKMESIMNGAGSAEEKMKKAADAQAEYSAAVMKLYQG